MNYVLLFPDEMRAESLACYGHPLVNTPNIDVLAAEGTLFENRYVQNPEYAKIVAAMEKEMLRWYIRTADVVPQLR